MKRPLGTIGAFLVILAIAGAILLARWLLWFGPGLPDRDYAVDFHAHALKINGVTAEEAAAGWAAWEAVVEAVVAADEVVSGRSAWQDDGTLKLQTMVLDEPEYQQEILAFLDELEAREAPELLDALLTAPPAVRPRYEGQLFAADHQDPQAARHLLRGLVVAMRAAIERDDAEHASRLARHMAALGRVYSAQPTLMESMQSQVFPAFLEHQIRWSLIEAHSADGTPLSVIDGLVESMSEEDIRPSVAAVLEGERLIALDFLARNLPAHTKLPFRPISRGAQAASVNTAYEEAIAFARRPAAERWGQTLDPPTFGRMDIMAGILVPAFDGFIRRWDQIAMSRHATLLMLHIERHIASQGAAPASLDDLDLPPEALRDPWSGKPYGYRTLSDDAHSRPYLLWAVGANGVDDGGVEHPDGNDRALSDAETSADWIVNQPRLEEK